MRALPALVAASTLFLTAAAPADSRDERMRDYGETLRRVDAARTAGDYQAAADALRGYLDRWQDGALRTEEIDAVLAKARRYVELRELLERAAYDNQAAARYLAAMVTHTDPSARTLEQVRALAILAKHSPALQLYLERAFPARLVVSIDTPPDFPPDHNEVLLQNALVDLTRAQPLQLFDDAGKGTLSVIVTVRENDRRNSILEGTAMKSWAVHVVTELADEQGARISSSAMTTAVLGINPGNAATYGMSKVADRVYASVIDELVRKVDRGDLL